MDVHVENLPPLPPEQRLPLPPPATSPPAAPAAASPPESPGWVAWTVTWLAFVAGIAASLAANVAHAAPSTGARLTAGWAPLALLLVVEVMIRVPAPRLWPLALARYLGTFAVAVVAAIASYRHMKGLALEYGEDELTASTLPLSADGLVVVSSIGLLTLADLRRRAIVAAQALVSVAAARSAATSPPLQVAPSTALPGESSPAVSTDLSTLPAVAAADAVAVGEAHATTTGGSAAHPAESSPPKAPIAQATLPPSDSDGLPVPLPLPLPESAPEPRGVMPLPLPLPLPPPVVPALPWPRRNGGSELPAGLLPTLERLDSDTRQLYERAYRRVMSALNAGGTPTGKEVGELCGRGERWGRDRIAEVREARRNPPARDLATAAVGP